MTSRSLNEDNSHFNTHSDCLHTGDLLFISHFERFASARGLPRLFAAFIRKPSADLGLKRHGKAKKLFHSVELTPARWILIRVVECDQKQAEKISILNGDVASSACKEGIGIETVETGLMAGNWVYSIINSEDKRGLRALTLP